jgi:hypothetical protein
MYRGGKCIKVNGKPEKECLCEPSVGNTIIKKMHFKYTGCARRRGYCDLGNKEESFVKRR